MRIIAGRYKGRKLNTLNHSGTRPTIDRVREAIFSKIQFDIKDGEVLDLFAGTGAMAFEALSRYAKTVYAVDNSKESFNLIKANNDLLKVKLNIFLSDAKDALLSFKNKNQAFNVIFLDPPYNTNLAEESLNLIAEYNLLKENGVIVWEHNENKLDASLPKGLIMYGRKRYGTVYVTYITTDTE